jgi:hypothetical protein
LGREQNDPAHLPECRKIGGWLLDLYKSGVLPSRFGVVDVLLARTRSEAPGLWSRLEPHSHDQRVELVQTDRELVDWGLAELVSRESERIAPESASQAMDLAELSVFLAESVEDDQPMESRWAYQLRALAWGYLGNARRAAGELPAAEQAFEMSDSWWKAGADTIGDALGYEPVLQGLKALYGLHNDALTRPSLCSNRLPRCI